jgi:hypothetical protein
MLQPRDQPDDFACRPDAGLHDLAALGFGQQPVADRLTCQIDDGIDLTTGRQLVEARDQRDRQRQHVCPRLVADQRGDLMPRSGQGCREPAADEAGGARDQHRLSPRQRRHELARRRAGQAGETI